MNFANPRRALAALTALLCALEAGAGFAQTLPQRINDSGQRLCYAGIDSVHVVMCSDSLWPGQDGAHGRDAAGAELVKIGAGVAGFDYTKISNAGADLPANAAPGGGPNDWGCTRDNTTGLLWYTVAMPEASWIGAQRAASDASGACGYGDWRLPDSGELMSLVFYAASDPAIDTDYFPDTGAAFYWTSETRVDGAAPRARVVNFRGGFVHSIERDAPARVRLVRGGESFAAPTDNGEGTVTDPRTGLMWARCSHGQNADTCAGEVTAMLWQNALQFVQQRNQQNWLGHDDWRMPNVKELASLVRSSGQDPAIDLDRFPNTPGAAYWSSTTYARAQRAAWGVFFAQGNVFAIDKGTPARVRLVRTATAAEQGSPREALFADGFDLGESAPAIPADSLPLITIDTAGGAPIDHDNYVDADMTITSDDPDLSYAGTLRIRGRGNSTWSMPKKPYKLKLDQKAPLLGLPDDKNWALLANYDDKTLLRNAVAFEAGNRAGAAWNPRSRHAEVVLNGDYLGIYQLTESIRVAGHRVDIAELDSDDTGPDVITGGYLLEQDGRRDCPANVQFDTAHGVPFCIDTPDEETIVPLQYDYIRSYVQSAENAAWSAQFADPVDGYAAWLDVDSFVTWYLPDELLKNTDARDFSSMWYFKDRDGKLNHGPLWDFDISAGNVNYGPGPDPRNWWIRDGTWYVRLFQDPAFAAAVRARWDAIKVTQIDTLPDYIDTMTASFGNAPAANFQRWPILDTYVWPNGAITGSFEGDIAYLKDWLRQRIAWLDANL